MARDHQHNPDPNENAVRNMDESTAGDVHLPAAVEAAWQAWLAHIQKVDQQGMTLLRAAFEAGFEAAARRR